MTGILSDWEGVGGFPAVDEADVTLLSQPELDSLIKISGGIVKYDLISTAPEIDSTFGDLFAVRFSGVTASAGAIWTFSPTLNKPPVNLRIRISVPGSLTGFINAKGFIYVTQCGGVACTHFLLAEGGLQYFNGSIWQFVDGSGNFTTVENDADKTLYVEDVPFTLDIVYASDTTYDVLINGSKVSNSPMLNRNSTPATDTNLIQIAQLNDTGEIWLGDVDIDNAVPPPVPGPVGGGNPFL